MLEDANGSSSCGFQGADKASKEFASDWLFVIL
jgi:hypothetical protein